LDYYDVRGLNTYILLPWGDKKGKEREGCARKQRAGGELVYTVGFMSVYEFSERREKS
jgi:hypothetical protein